MSPPRSAAKRRVDKATKSLTGTKCLIENTDGHNQVQYVHCLPPTTNSSILDFLEYHWNLDRGTLNVDSRENVIRLSPKFQYLFENKLMFLLPEPHIINLYYEAATARLTPAQRRASFPERTYQYRLIAHPYMKRVPIHRQRDSSIENDDSALVFTDFAFHSYPYDRFPVIVSHVHPRYVIYNAGQKISRNCRTYLEEFPSLALDILGVKDTYEAWTSAPKYNDPFLETKMAPQDVDIDSDSNATRKRRARTKPQKQNPQTANRPSKRTTKDQPRGTKHYNWNITGSSHPPVKSDKMRGSEV
ncbi:hypothetical protein Clacol_006989 [Clathrus columnatus]|uniref:HNH nuclease domain-containing protein n=1 Tax=Clathrus columnatus TaxID=1419009 RepID=A0AAV5AJA4_9AGAM|nr:hypothetical protein Clacol_006989 [Clathrus columnatus]